MDSFGKRFRVTVFGESHGPEIGVVIDGVPAGISLSENDFANDLARRKAGGAGTTPRRETDEPQIVSGVYGGYTSGAPLAVVFRNGNTRSSDYGLFSSVPRPGHADRTASVKWGGFQDPRGGGHFSGRLTLALVAAGVVAKKVLSMRFPVGISACLTSLGGISVSSRHPQANGPALPERVEDDGFPEEWVRALQEASGDGDSLGGVIECAIDGFPAGYGEPFFDSIESCISHMVFSVPGVRGVEFGDGFAAAAMRGSEHNDPFGPDGLPVRNGAGGVNGGISNGGRIVFRVAVKPTSSIRKPQQTYDFSRNEMSSLAVPGRHDVCFALRTPVIIEAAAAVVLADMVLQG